MAKKTGKAANDGEQETGRRIPEQFRTWTWGDFAEWTDAGSVQRGKGYVGHVSDVAAGKDGRVVATVFGTHKYATEVRVDGEGQVEGRCSCPVGHRCKHTVALILKCIELLEAGKTVPPIEEDDWRLEKLGDEDDWDEDDEEDEDSEEEDGTPPSRRAASGSGELDAFVESLGNAEAKRLLKSIIKGHRVVRNELERRLRDEQGNVGKLLQAARRELSEASEEYGYGHPWSQESYTPDYSKLRKTLERLRALKAGRELAEFGRHLIEDTYEQIECSDDEGETADEVASCLAVVAAAVREAPDMSEADKLRWFYEMSDMADFDIVRLEDEPFQHPEQWSPAAWSALADDLAQSFAQVQESNGEVSSYYRERLLKSLASALDHAGRTEEARTARVAFFHHEHKFNALARLLLGEGNLDEAWDTAANAAAKVERDGKTEVMNEGLSDLRETLRDIARARKDERMALTIQAEDFFAAPSAPGFRDLLAAAAPSGFTDALRAPLIRFLETGERPTYAKRSDWPLKPSGIPENSENHRDSGAEILLEIALEEKNSDDILRRWRELPATGSRSPWDRDPRERYGDAVADALAVPHPEVSLEIWEAAIKKRLPETGKYAYEQIAALLRKERGPMTSLGRSAEWTARVRELREAYKRRRLFVEILDGLLASGRPIFGSRKR